MTLHCMADHGIKADIMTLQVDGPESAFSKGSSSETRMRPIMFFVRNVAGFHATKRARAQWTPKRVRETQSSEGIKTVVLSETQKFSLNPNLTRYSNPALALVAMSTPVKRSAPERLQLPVEISCPSHAAQKTFQMRLKEIKWFLRYFEPVCRRLPQKH